MNALYSPPPLQCLFTFRVAGEPVPQGSKSIMPAGRRRGGRPILVEGGDLSTQKKPANRLRDWRSTAGWAGQQALMESGLNVLNEPLVLEVLFILPRPETHITKATRRLPRDEQRLIKSAPALPGFKPDLSKLMRGLEDGLEGHVFSNDSRIVGYLRPCKIYDDEQPMGALVGIWRVSA